MYKMLLKSTIYVWRIYTIYDEFIYIVRNPENIEIKKSFI